MVSDASLQAYKHLCGTKLSSSWTAGWRSLLLCSYIDPLEVEELDTPETPDHLIVLTTAGSCEVESYRDGRWYHASARPGNLSMTAPGHTAKLRWRSSEPSYTLQLHLPSKTIEAVADEVQPGALISDRLPNLLSQTDPVIATTMTALENAFHKGAPDLYAATAAHFLTVHLLTHHALLPEPRSYPWRDYNLRKADIFMREHLSEPVTLDQLAEVVGLSIFQLLRAAKAAWGETPLRRLTRLRMELAKRLLENHHLSILEIALECGYGNPSHFSTAFRRQVGVSPRAYRQR